MDEFEKHYAEQRKLDTKDYIFHLYEMSRKDKSVKTENKSVMPRAWGVGGRWSLSAKGHEGALWRVDASVT